MLKMNGWRRDGTCRKPFRIGPVVLVGVFAIGLLSRPVQTQGPAGLVALWAANGDARDSVGSLHGSPGAGVSFGPGRFGQAFQLDGKGYIQMPARRWGLTAHGTMTAWIKTTKSGGAVASLYHGRVQDELLLMLVDGKLGFFASTREGVYAARVSKAAVNTGSWVFVAGVIDGTNGPASLRVYINGSLDSGTVLSSGTPVPPSDETPRSLRIGWRTNEWTPELFAGAIDEVAVFNRTLTAAQIAEIYRSGPLGQGGPDAGPGDTGKPTTPTPKPPPAQGPVFVDAADARTSWEQAKKSLPAIFSLSDAEARRFRGVIHLNIGDSRMVYPAPGNQLANADTGLTEHLSSPANRLEGFFATPPLVFDATRDGPLALQVKGLSKGVGSLFCRVPITIRDRATNRVVDANFDSVYVVVVHEVESTPPPKIEIPYLEVVGRAIRKENGEPVEGARITLVWLGTNGSILGSYLEDANIRTERDGRFVAVARRLPRGRYEVMVQLLGQRSGPPPPSGLAPPQGQAAPGIGVDNDLWPYQQNVLDVTPELATRGALNVGDIVLDRVRFINFANRPVKELRPTIPGIIR